MKISEAFLRLFFPPKCIVCEKVLDFFAVKPYCNECYADLKTAETMTKSYAAPPHIDSLYVMYTYKNDSTKYSVFHAKKTFSKQFKVFYEKSCKNLFEKLDFVSSVDIITFVTRRSSEKRREGIDQAEQMAKIVSKLTEIPYTKTLVRTRKSKKQRLLSDAERAENVRGLFKSCQDVRGKYILLVDDVMTTGSTLSECAKTLKKAGAKQVIAMVFAN